MKIAVVSADALVSVGTISDLANNWGAHDSLKNPRLQPNSHIGRASFLSLTHDNEAAPEAASKGYRDHDALFARVCV
jgi:hypothetical protein